VSVRASDVCVCVRARAQMKHAWGKVITRAVNKTQFKLINFIVLCCFASVGTIDQPADDPTSHFAVLLISYLRSTADILSCNLHIVLFCIDLLMKKHVPSTFVLLKKFQWPLKYAL
jgi:hypothetical protein